MTDEVRTVGPGRHHPRGRAAACRARRLAAARGRGRPRRRHDLALAHRARARPVRVPRQPGLSAFAAPSSTPAAVRANVRAAARRARRRRCGPCSRPTATATAPPTWAGRRSRRARSGWASATLGEARSLRRRAAGGADHGACRRCRPARSPTPPGSTSSARRRARSSALVGRARRAHPPEGRHRHGPLGPVRRTRRSPPRAVAGDRLGGLCSHLATVRGARHRPSPTSRSRGSARSPTASRRARGTSPTRAAPCTSPAPRFDMARCGIALYGISPSDEDAAADGLTPVLSWTSQVRMVRRARAGRGERLRPARSGPTAPLTRRPRAGGLRRRLPAPRSPASAEVAGRRPAPCTVGAVAMDQLGAHPAARRPRVAVGDEVTLVGRAARRARGAGPGGRAPSATRSPAACATGPTAATARCAADARPASRTLRRPRPRAGSSATSGWIVGGAVRDHLLDRPVDDWDVLVAGDPGAAARAHAAAAAARRSRSASATAPGASWTRAAWSTSRRCTGSLPEDLAPPRLHRQRDRRRPGRRRGRPTRTAASTTSPQRRAARGRRRRLPRRPAAPAAAAAARRRAGVRRLGGGDAPLARARRRPGRRRAAGERQLAELQRHPRRARPGRRAVALRPASACWRPCCRRSTRLHGVEQSAFHHLDVFDHTLHVIDSTADVAANVAHFFPDAAVAAAIEARSPRRSTAPWTCAPACAGARCCTTSPSRTRAR